MSLEQALREFYARHGFGESPRKHPKAAFVQEIYDGERRRGEAGDLDFVGRRIIASRP